MTYFTNKDKTFKRMSILFMFVFIGFSNASVYGQGNQKEVVFSTTNEVIGYPTEERTSTSNMDFVLWFMGSKQDPNSTISTEGINIRKKIMTSGLTPNRLLINAFLKKAVDFESGLV